MKTWSRYVLMFLAYGFALLHTAIPHHHVESGRGEVMFSHANCSYAHSSGGVLQRAITTDLGLGHLETFKKSADTRIVLSSRGVETIALPPAYCTEVASEIIREFRYGLIGKLKLQLLLFSVTHFRAPPVSL
ncbi:MAG: hypothetical protein M3Y60_14005 [Bacteroidota bacterium]|nr:hypothetical protein [Bacteroidota bacterium]